LELINYRTTFLGPIFCCLLACSGSSGDGYDSSGTSTPSPTPNPPQGSEATVNTETVRARSLAVCLNCHNGTQLPQASDLRTPEAVKANASVIQFQVNTDRMPKPGFGFPPLDACQKEILNKWIELGLPDSTTFKVNMLTNCPNGLILNELDLESEDALEEFNF